MQLRPYQREAIDAVKRDWSEGHKATLGVAATGLGKTQIFLGLLTETIGRSRARALILSHRQELVFQPIERLYQFWPEWKGRAGAVMGEYDESNRQVVSATFQTLFSDKRLQRLLAHGAFEYVIFDECHHLGADRFFGVYERLREANPGMLSLGVTATPIRADGKGLRAVFGHVSFKYDIKWAIKNGWLAPPRWLAIQTGISLANVKTVAGDFVGRQLADVFETENCFDLVVKSHRDFADGRQAIAFTESVDGAYRLAEAFRKAGIPAEAADGTTRKDDRRDVLNRYRAGDTHVLCNAQLFTEGVDLPNTSCMHMVRPTKSDGAYIQMVGRGLRLAPGKEDCVILDYAPVECRNIVMLGDVLGVEARKEAYLDDKAEEGEVAGGFTFDGQVKWLKGDPTEIISRELDYLELSPWSWNHGDDHWLTLGLGQDDEGVDRTLVISPPDAKGLCCLWTVARHRATRSEAADIVAEDTFERVSELAEELIEKHGQLILTQKQKSWRKQPASEKQREFAMKLGVWQDGMTKGACAEAITRTLALRTVRRYGRRVAA